jgi:glycosyltransferase involved in cell wall biosynthesis
LEAEEQILVECCAPRSTTSAGALLKIFRNLRFLGSSCLVIWQRTRPGDCIHFQHILHFPLGAAFFLVSRLRGLRIVFTVHDPVPHNWLLPPSLRWIAKRTLQWAYAVSDLLVVHSEAGKLALVREFAQEPGRIEVIAHGPYPFSDELSPLPSWDRLELLLFGSIRENKGVHLAVEAVQRLHSEGVQVRLTIAGCVLNRTERGYWERCERLIAREPVAIVVREEFIPDSCLPELFGQAHCLLLPYTRFASDSGVAFMALANRRTIIATRVGGLSGLLDSAGGIAIQTDTVDAVCEAIRQALALGPNELSLMGKKGAAYVMTECGWPKVAQDTKLAYAALGVV